MFEINVTPSNKKLSHILLAIDNGMYFRKTVWIHGNKYISAEMSNSFKRRATALKFFSNAKSKFLNIA